MSSEVPEVGAPPSERPPRRGGEGGAPVSGALTIVLAVVAVVAGFLILRAITGGDDSGTTLPTGPGATVTTPPDETDEVEPPVTTEPAPTTTTEPPLVVDGATVVVANANGVNGSAGAMSDLLAEVGYIMGTPTNATTGQLDSTVIYYDPDNEAALAVAESVNRSLGGDSNVAQVGTPAPAGDGSVDGDVLVLLGNDKAGRSLAELAPATGADDDAETTVTAPEVSGGDADPDDEVIDDEGVETDG
jgi:hypothetical protein